MLILLSELHVIWESFIYVANLVLNFSKRLVQFQIKTFSSRYFFNAAQIP